MVRRQSGTAKRKSAAAVRSTAALALFGVAVELQFVTQSLRCFWPVLVTASKIVSWNMLDSSRHGNAPKSCVGNRKATGDQRAGSLQRTSREDKTSRLQFSRATPNDEKL